MPQTAWNEGRGACGSQMVWRAYGLLGLAKVVLRQAEGGDGGNARPRRVGSEPNDLHAGTVA
jgi:hypothetical protein